MREASGDVAAVAEGAGAAGVAPFAGAAHALHVQHLREQRDQPLARLHRRGPCMMVARALEGALEALRRHRLEQVVERVHLERADRVLVEGRDEDDRRHPRRPARVDHREPVHPRHLHVEEEQVDVLALEHRERLRPVAALRHELGVRLRADEALEAAPRERLVVGDRDADRHGQAGTG